MASKNTCGCCLFPMTEEQQEWRRKWKAGEIAQYCVDIPSELVPELGHDAEIIVETKQEPREGDVIAITISRGDYNWCKISLYCDQIQEAIDYGEVELLGVVVQYRPDPFEASGDDLKLRKFVRAEIPEIETAAG